MSKVSPRIHPLAAAVSMALSSYALPQLASAQGQAPRGDEAMEEIVVTAGYRKSLIDSIDTKRDSALIIEAISAEDIGKLPDHSIADAIARLPGIAAQRLDGRASSISIRGLGEDYSATTINGREQVSIGDNRGVEFDVYPSEIVSGVVVYKTPNASLATQGVAGVIDMRTVRPLEYDDRIVKFSAFYESSEIGALNPDGEDAGFRLTAAYLDQLMDGRLGVAVVYNQTTSPNNEQRWNSWGYPGTQHEDEDVLILGGAKPFVRSSELDRDSISAALQFEPNESFELNVDMMFIDFADEKILRGIEVPVQWGGPGPVNITEVQDGVVTQATIAGRSPVLRNDYETREAELTAFGVNGKYHFGDGGWTLEFDLARSEVERTVWSLESYATGSGRGGQGTLANIDFDQRNFSGVQFTSDIDYRDRDVVQLGAAQTWGDNHPEIEGGQDGFINIPSIEDELGTYRVDVSRHFEGGGVAKVQFGAYLSDRTKTKEDTGLYLLLNREETAEPIPDDYYLGTTDLSFIGFPGLASYDSFRFWQDGRYEQLDGAVVDLGRTTNDYTVNEEVLIAYAMADFEFDVLNGLLVNVGLQWVETDQSSRGNLARIEADQLDVVPVDIGSSYSQWLPSVSFNLSFTEEMVLRGGWARTQSRSRMDRLNAGGSYGFNPTENVPNGRPFTFSGGNPNLRPNRANQLDLSFEYYFRPDSYVAVAWYWKQLSSWQVQRDLRFDMADLLSDAVLADLAGAGVMSTLGTWNLWTESRGGKIDGVEFSAALPIGAWISDALDGLGVYASLALVDSSLNDPNSNRTIPVPGLSEEIINFTAYYEKAGFEGRVSVRQREDFLGERFGISFTREYASVVGATLWDVQFSYDFSEIGIDGLAVTFQGLNLTDEPYETRHADTGLTVDYQEFGATYLLGVSYEL